MHSKEIRRWAVEQLEVAEEKVKRNIKEIGADFPHEAHNGKWTLPGCREWTAGFWSGMLWLTYARTGNAEARKVAEQCELLMDDLLARPEAVAHDVGFQWVPAAVADYKLTGNEQSKIRGLRAAKLLASRFNPAGYIRSWSAIPGYQTESWTIIDNMMNLPILYWANEEFHEPGFYTIAKKHTDTVIQYAVRPDGSVNHIIKLDPYTGEWIEDRNDCVPLTQGRNVNSAWTRGAAWAIYGLALSYRYTKCKEHLDAAKRCAHYFMAALDDTGVPPSDFRYGNDAPGQDSSAGACAACGLLEIEKHVPEEERIIYARGAEKILKGLAQYCTADKTAQNILDHGSTHFWATKTRDIGLIYGDYFYMEALNRLGGKEIFFW